MLRLRIAILEKVAGRKALCLWGALEIVRLLDNFIGQQNHSTDNNFLANKIAKNKRHLFCSVVIDTVVRLNLSDSPREYKLRD